MNQSDKKKFIRSFEEEAKFWINALGLKEWRFTFERRDFNNDDLAQCSYNCVAKYAFLSLNDKWLDGEIDGMPVDEPNDDRTRLAAFHEVCETLLADIEDVLLEDPKNTQRINTERHRIIRRLENVLFPLKNAIAKEK